jgi:hypothetical protein
MHMAKKAKSEKKNLGQNHGFPAVLYTIGLIALALGIMVFSSLLLPRFDPVLRDGGSGRFMHPPPGAEETGSGEIGEYFIIRLALSFVNLVVIVYLLFIHVRDYLRLRSKFTLGLVAFLFSFLLYALSTVPVVHMMLGPYGIASRMSYVPMLFSALGLLIFAKLSNE